VTAENIDFPKENVQVFSHNVEVEMHLLFFGCTFLYEMLANRYSNGLVSVSALKQCAYRAMGKVESVANVLLVQTFRFSVNLQINCLTGRSPS